MAQIFPGRYSAYTDEPLVVFMIGMRVNKPLAISKWLPIFSAMGPMLSTLYRHPEKGFLGGQTSVYWPGVMLVQYWRSLDDLMNFARSPGEPHLPAWQRFNKAVGADGSVGIWHETYVVEAGNYETIYGNMPRFGLANVVEHVAATDERVRMQKRALARSSEFKV